MTQQMQSKTRLDAIEAVYKIRGVYGKARRFGEMDFPDAAFAPNDNCWRIRDGSGVRPHYTV
jgi:hypothetical protein